MVKLLFTIQVFEDRQLHSAKIIIFTTPSKKGKKVGV